MHGEQPYGITLKGDTLLYVTDNLHGDAERIYSYNLTTRQDIGFVDLPDPDGDQSPRGMYYDGTYLYLVAQRIGGSAFAYQTVYIYDFDAMVGIGTPGLPAISAYPSPANERVVVELPFSGKQKNARLEVYNATGACVLVDQFNGPRHVLETSAWPSGPYVLRASLDGQPLARSRFMVVH